MVSWDKYDNFQESEFRCKETFECDMSREFMDVLQNIRSDYNKPMVISSGYRSVLHSKEVEKVIPGEHVAGMCADVLVSGLDALVLTGIAIKHGITRIGLHQRGKHSDRFIHIGMGDQLSRFWPSGIWTY